jgi:hypothetical protein
MNARRSSTKATIRLEALEDRITPVAIHPHIASMGGALFGKTNPAAQLGSSSHSNPAPNAGHRQLPIGMGSHSNIPHPKTPKLIHLASPVVTSPVSPVSGRVPGPTQPILWSSGMSISRRPARVIVPLNPAVPPIVPLDPNGGVPASPSNPPSGPVGTPAPEPAPVITEPILW